MCMCNLTMSYFFSIYKFSYRINSPCLTLSGLAGLRGCSDVVSFCACWCWCWWSSEAVTVAAPFIVPPRSFVIRLISNALKPIHVFFIYFLTIFNVKYKAYECKNFIIIFCSLLNLLQSFLKRNVIYFSLLNWRFISNITTNNYVRYHVFICIFLIQNIYFNNLFFIYIKKYHELDLVNWEAQSQIIFPK